MGKKKKALLLTLRAEAFPSDGNEPGSARLKARAR